jgi:hypothetical protein
LFAIAASDCPPSGKRVTLEGRTAERRFDRGDEIIFHGTIASRPQSPMLEKKSIGSSGRSNMALTGARDQSCLLPD